MKSRKQRLLMIKKVIGNQKITRQKQLLEILRKKGFILTQATLSRDLKALKVGKIPDEKGERYYFFPGETLQHNNIAAEIPMMPFRAFLSLEFSNNLGVIKTVPAYSHSIASKIDELHLYELLGTLAGNDTVLLILREAVSHNDIKNALIDKFPELKNKI